MDTRINTLAVVLVAPGQIAFFVSVELANWKVQYHAVICLYLY